MSGQPPNADLDFTLQRDAWGQLALVDAAEQRFENVVAVRAFPVSNVDRWISICDAQGREIVCIERLDDVAPPVRAVLAEELARREFFPVILRILSATTKEPSEWEVLTDRGPSTFQINNEDDVRRVDRRAASVLDSHGVRYLIPDIRRLDAASRRILDHFL